MSPEYNVFIMDCDGVILDSNAFKSDAFRTVLAGFDYPRDLIDLFVQYHKDNGGLSRYVKFRVFITDYLKIPFDQDLYEELLKKFSDYCIRSYEKVSLTPHAVEFLKAFKDKADLYIASGSDENELLYVLGSRKIKEYFKDIFGSPKTKEECISIVVKRNPDKNIVVIGDSKSDFIAAKDSGADFIFMRGFSEAKAQMTELANEHQFRIIETLHDLLPVQSRQE